MDLEQGMQSLQSAYEGIEREKQNLIAEVKEIQGAVSADADANIMDLSNHVRFRCWWFLSPMLR